MNGDYLDYLAHYRTPGSKNGISTTPGYDAIGKRAMTDAELAARRKESRRSASSGKSKNFLQTRERKKLSTGKKVAIGLGIAAAAATGAAIVAHQMKKMPRYKLVNKDSVTYGLGKRSVTKFLGEMNPGAGRSRYAVRNAAGKVIERGIGRYAFRR